MIFYAVVMIDDLLADAMEKMAKASSHVLDEFSAVRTGRATPALVEKLRIDYYGAETPLQQLASFSVPEARVLIIAPFDKGCIKAIEKAIVNSDLGVSPNGDGVVIRLNFPALTQERRKDYVKIVKSKAEDGKIALRNVRRSVRTSLEKLEKDSTISSDELKRAEKDLDKITDEYVGEIEKHLAAKETELMEV
jgi:ribosome recycling factor